MSKGLLVAKVLGGTTIVGAVGGGGGYWIFNFLKSEENKNYVIAIEKTAGVNESTDYKCALSDDSKKFDDDCVVKVLKLPDNHKKHIKFSDVSSTSTNPSIWVDPTTELLNSNNAYYRIQVNTDLFNALKDSPTKTLDISFQGTLVKKLTTAFMVGQNNVVPTKASYAVGKVSSFLKTDGSTSSYTDSGPITIEKDNVKCDFVGSTPKTDVGCKIYKFTNDSSHAAFDTISFFTNSDIETQITKDHYYLFKLTSENDASEPANFISPSVVKATVTTSVPDSAKDITALQISDLKPVFFIPNYNNDVVFLHSGSQTRT